MTTPPSSSPRPPATPPYDIVRAAYAELRVTDLAASERFYVDLLGMVVAERTPDTLYLRGWEERLHHSLVLRRGAGRGAARLGFRVRREEDLDLLAADLDAHGLATEWARGPEPGVGRALRLWDPFGYPLEFFHEMEQLETQLQRFDLHRGAPILRFDHFNLHTPRIEDAFRFWTGLGFRCSEYISTDGEDERITGAWLAAQAERARRRPHGGPRAAAAPRQGSGSASRRASCAPATSSRRPATRTRSSADPGATASRTRSSSTCATPTATASSSTRATTTRAIPTTSRCAGR